MTLHSEGGNCDTSLLEKLREMEGVSEKMMQTLLADHVEDTRDWVHHLNQSPMFDKLPSPNVKEAHKKLLEAERLIADSRKLLLE